MNDMTKGNIFKTILFFAIPMMFSSILQEIFYTTDSIVVGNFMGNNGASAIAAIGASLPIIMLVLSVAIGISIGSSIIISQQVGAKEIVQIKQTISTTIISCTFLSIILGIIGFIFTPQMLAIIQVPNDIMNQAISYLRIVFVGIAFIVGYNQISGVFRGMGDSKTPLIIVFIATVLNLVMDLLFVAVFNWGVNGVALATIIAQGISFIIGIIILIRKQEMLSPNILNWKFSVDTFKKIAKLATPIGLEMIITSGGLLLVSAAINRLGTSVIAGAYIANALEQFAVMPILAVAQAISVFSGQNIGAGKMSRVSRGVKSGLIMGIFISILVSSIAIIFSHQLGGLFTKNADAIFITSQYFIIVASFYFLFGIMQIIAGAIMGSGQTFIPMLISVVSLWLIRVPLAYILGFKYGSSGIWWSQPFAWIIGCIAITVYYFCGNWRKKSD